MSVNEVEVLPSIVTELKSKKQPLSWSFRLVIEVAGLKPSHKYVVQLIRSMIVSVVALIADFGALVLLKEKAGFNYLIAATLSFSLGMTVNYILSVKWVFAFRKLDSYHKEFIIFVILGLVGLVLNLLIIAFVVSQLELDYRFAKAISAVLVFFWNFIARKKLLY